MVSKRRALSSTTAHPLLSSTLTMTATASSVQGTLEDTNRSFRCTELRGRDAGDDRMVRDFEIDARMPRNSLNETVVSSVPRIVAAAGLESWPKVRRRRGSRSLMGLWWLGILSTLARGTAQPTLEPSLSPTPTASNAPSSIPTMSQNPTITPLPTTTMSPSTSEPSRLTTDEPSVGPSPFPSTTVGPSASPSSSVQPSHVPTESPIPTPVPSGVPTVTAQPTDFPSELPTGVPTVTAQPTDFPSESPTNIPTASPSVSPSAEPTFSNVIQDRQSFSQRFTIASSVVFNDTEQALFCGYMANLTTIFNTREQDDDRILTTCEIRSQELFDFGPDARRLGSRRLQTALNDIGYRMTWLSRHENVTGYSLLFLSTVNQDLLGVAADLQALGLDVLEAERAFPSLASEPPTMTPTESSVPSASPTVKISGVPSLMPSQSPSMPPSAISPEPAPTVPPTPDSGSSSTSTAIIVAVSIVGISAVLVALFMFYRYRKRLQEKEYQNRAAASRRSAEPRLPGDSNIMVDTQDPAYTSTTAAPIPLSGMISPSLSLRSNQSMLSTGESMGMGGESDDEADGTENLADEFDQFKDQNLERMRNEVEGNVAGVDGMMSQALTKALMEDDAQPVDIYDLSWGGKGDSMEIEASALCEANDWLKRKEMASEEERRMFMQELLNKMVASVRHGIMKPVDASRAIHECAAMLGLRLAHEIPENSVIVTGMRKRALSKKLEEVFQEFGEIDKAAVASNSRGFGLVRFKSPRSVQRVMSKYHRDEIVIQDVAVMVKVLKSEGTGRPNSQWEQGEFQGQLQSARETSPASPARNASRGEP